MEYVVVPTCVLFCGFLILCGIICLLCWMVGIPTLVIPNP